jgi:two-component system sensor histidine kinase BaeS
MRSRLTISIVVVVAITLAVTTAGSYYFIRRAALSTAQQELNGQARAIANTFSQDTTITRRSFVRELGVIAKAGAFAGVGVVALLPDGTIKGTIPSGLTATQLDIPALQAGDQTSGHTRSLLVYTAVPTPIARVTRFVPVVVITRQAHNPVNGLRYFAFVGVIGLAVAALVAAALARRFSRPLVSAVGTTHRIAAGDLDATVPLRPREIPEFAQLAASINTMGANLVRARDQERQFLLSVSHELRTPLTSIRGYADAVIDGATDDPAAAAAVISTEAKRLERLVQDLLDLARLDADRFSLDIGTVDATAVVRSVVDSFVPRAADLGLVLEGGSRPGSDGPPAGPVWVRADPDRLGQVVANLVENAASFAQHRITVGSGATPTGPAVWVVDDGPGIRPDELAHVFERHFSSDRVRGRRKGTGLGLAIVAELASAMGARVDAESPVADGRGTSMVVRLQPSPAPTPSASTPPPPMVLPQVTSGWSGAAPAPVPDAPVSEAPVPDAPVPDAPVSEVSDG